MSVKIIRQYGQINYKVEIRRVRIEFKDGSHMVGDINIHAKYNETESDDADYAVSSGQAKYKFRRTSDYLKDCNQSEGLITVFNAIYDGRQDRVCCVFLHSVKFISEEEVIPLKKDKPKPVEEEPIPERTEFSLWDRLKKREEDVIPTKKEKPKPVAEEPKEERTEFSLLDRLKKNDVT